MPVGHFAKAAEKGFAQPFELVLGLEGRIDQHDTAPLLRRHEGRQRHPAVEVDHAGLFVATQHGDQRLPRLRLDLAGDEAVLRPEQARAINGEPG